MDCLIGCSNALTKLKNIFNKSRNKTNHKMIKMPYRNGILHGRDLNYANEYVSCKCLALMFAVADWMRMKDSEEDRKKEYNEATNLPPLRELLIQRRNNKEVQKEIEAWERRNICIGKDIPKSGSVENYKEYPYIIVVIKMLDAWRDNNYGDLSKYLNRLFSKSISDGKRAGECRKLFEDKQLISFELVEIEERACSLSKVVVKVMWKENEKVKGTELTFGCCYKNNENQSEVAVPWRNNGEWIMIPWDVQGLYSQWEL